MENIHQIFWWQTTKKFKFLEKVYLFSNMGFDVEVYYIIIPFPGQSHEFGGFQADYRSVPFRASFECYFTKGLTLA
jgi:hypothetical protein